MSKVFDPKARRAHELSTIRAIYKTPWDTAVEPMQVAPHVYYVGNNWVGVFWLDTPEGIVLFDAGLPSQTYLIFEGMRQMGFSPQQIKLVFLSHAHYDHCGGLKAVLEYTGAKCYCAQEDAQLLKGDSEALLNCGLEYQAATPDGFFQSGDCFSFGGYTIEPMVIGGHTKGTTCFFFQDQDADGNRYQVGIHGGLGLSRLADDYFTNAEDAFAARAEYRTAQAAVYHRRVDIPLSYHPYNLSIIEKVRTASWPALVDSSAWQKMLDERLKALSDLENNSIFTHKKGDCV